MSLREFFYEIVLLLLALATIPKMLYHRIFYGKYKKSFFKRFGFGFPAIVKGQRKLIWIHAVSVGETKAVAALAKMLKRQHDNLILVISSTTETGHDEAVRSIAIADYHVYLPLDFCWIIRPIINRTKPDLVIVVETDFWYNFLKSSKDSGALVAVVNGKISTSSLKRFQSFKKMSEMLFSQINLFCVQNELYKQRFEQLEISAEKFVITGNMKFDEVYPQLSEEELVNWKLQLGIAPGDLVLVAGSTHKQEEEIILSALHEVWKKYPRLKLLLVPRHPERFNEVAGILSSQRLSFARLSEWNAKNEGSGSVVLIDAMGVLRKCYQLADIAIVGGSYTDNVGGHNIIEPCWYGVPVLFGPHMFKQIELVNLVKEYDAGEQVTAEALTAKLLEYLGNQEKRMLLGSGGLRLTDNAKGATQKTFDAISAKWNPNSRA